jgi:hypothetical protein
MRRSYALWGLVSSLWLGGCSFDGLDGNGQRVEETREVGAFTRLQNDADLDVELVQGDVQTVTISIDSNLQRLVRTHVHDDTLFLDVRRDIDAMVRGPHVLITVPELRGARLAGSGRMTLALDEPTVPLDLHLSGSGNVQFDGNVAALGAFLDGSGEMRLEGETQDVELSLSGSGAIRGRDLLAQSGALDLSGSGTLSANVADSVRVSLSGSGRIDVFGGATVESSHRTGSGDIDYH